MLVKFSRVLLSTFVAGTFVAPLSMCKSYSKGALRHTTIEKTIHLGQARKF